MLGPTFPLKSISTTDVVHALAPNPCVAAVVEMYPLWKGGGGRLPTGRLSSQRARAAPPEGQGSTDGTLLVSTIQPCFPSILSSQPPFLRSQPVTMAKSGSLLTEDLIA